MNADAAELLGLKALGWLAGQEELLPVFLGSTGVTVDELKSRASEPEFLGAVLAFLTMDDAWVLAFSEASGEAPEALLTARRSLPGGEEVNWT